MHAVPRPEWQLPQGVPRGAWQYAQDPQIAAEYDECFADSPLFEFDQQVIARHLSRPGLVVDLGAGTGRALIPLARRGFACLAVDLSLPMLRIVGRKAREEGLSVWRLQANLVELDCLRTDAADYCLCLFSTLGMIRGREHRQRVLAHACRLLKPGGLLVVHVHNVWFNLFCAEGRRFLTRHVPATWIRRDLELGDKFFDYHGIAKMFLHTFTRRQLVRSLRRAGFRIRELIPLAVDRQRPLPCPWFFGRLRANGWIAVCQKEAGARGEG